MEQLSKEEVLRSIADKNGDFFQLTEFSDYFDGSASTVLSAMETYAKQTAIAFAKWIPENGSGFAFVAVFINVKPGYEDKLKNK